MNRIVDASGKLISLVATISARIGNTSASTTTIKIVNININFIVSAI